MNNNIIPKFLIISAGIILFITACKKDNGNYDYGNINEVSFINIDTVAGYQVYLGDTLRITPELKGSQDESFSGSYSYEWKLRLGLDGSVLTGESEPVLSTSPDLNYPVTLKPGNYVISLSVKDNKTGVSFIQAMRVTVITQYYQGWLVLEKVGDTSRLDFISYMDNSFTVKENILSLLNPGMPPLADPYQIAYFNNNFLTGMRGVYLLTGAGAAKLDVENFRYNPQDNIANSMVGGAPAGFKAEKTYMVPALSKYFYDNLLLYSNHNIYMQPNGAYTNAPINTSGVTGQTFNISSEITTSTGNSTERVVMYNEDEKKFYTAQRNGLYAFSPAFEVDASLNFPSGMELVFMYDNDIPFYIGTNFGYAVLKDPSTAKLYMLRFSYVEDNLQAQDYYSEITGTDFALAEHYAISPNLGYLFYSVGGKVYEYDLFLKTSKLMLDKGSDQISLLVFDNNYKPEEWVNSLMVGSYNPAGENGKNGTLAQYSVPPVNGNLVEQNKWTGLGQVVSVSYRTR